MPCKYIAIPKDRKLSFVCSNKSDFRLETMLYIMHGADALSRPLCGMDSLCYFNVSAAFSEVVGECCMFE
jgi:hypothetical protein